MMKRWESRLGNRESAERRVLGTARAFPIPDSPFPILAGAAK